jgi:tRNA-dihydrouridine synthase
VADIERIKVHTGCPAVMIGRGAIGNPWIFSRLERAEVPPEVVRATMQRHLGRMLDFYGPVHGLVWFRKHAERYLRPYHLPVELRQQLLTSESVEVFQRLVDQIVQI